MSGPLTRRALLIGGPAAALSLPSCTARAASSRPVSTLVWTEDLDGFGGFSGIELMPNRLDFLAVSDQGYLVQGRLRRDPDGRLNGVSLIDRQWLQDADGARVTARSADAEGLVLMEDGSFLVSFEGGTRSRVDRFGAIGGRAHPLPRHPDWARVGPNLALESVAVDASGAVYAYLESAGANGFALYRQTGTEAWQIIGHLPATDDFVPVGADFGPDGNLYVLLRKFRVAFFANRIVRLRPGDWNRPDLLVETSYGLLDNHEGISITADDSGRLWATTISDDNLRRLQRTEIAEFLLG